MYWTELMQEILSSTKAKEIVQNLAPVYEDAYVFLWFLQILGMELDQLKSWVESCNQEIIVQKATWSLPLWEKRYGVEDVSGDISKRRKRVLKKMSTTAPMLPNKIANVASVAAGGVEAWIIENVAKNTFHLYLACLPSQIDVNKVEKEVNKVKPAHLIYQLKYDSEYGKAIIYILGQVRYIRNYIFKGNY